MTKPEEFHSATIPDSRLLRGILGLRGIAAIAVLLSHICYFTKIELPEGFHFIERDFPYGAQLFFVLSAFSLMHSTAHTTNRPDWVKEYLIKRFFRIAPLFYMILAFMLAWYLRSSLPSISSILLNIFFAFGFIQNANVGLVWGGWTIGVEMIFYILFPVLLVVIKTNKEALIFMIVAVLISYVSRVELYADFLKVVPFPKSDWNWGYYMFVPNLYFFAVGIYAYKYEKTLIQNDKPLHFLIPLATVISIGALLFADIGKPFKNDARLDLIIWAFAFGALCTWQSAKPSLWCANKYCDYLGERSFSIYLLHPLIIYFSKGFIIHLYSKLEPSIGAYAYFVCAVVVIGEVLIMAEITYRAIEVPGIKLGRKIIEARRGIASLITVN